MSELNPTIGPDRVNLAATPRADVDDLERKGLLIVDGRRARSHYFDGRFLAARDLTREQTYFLTREADLAQASGAGVMSGLGVTVTGARALRVAAGQGITAAGELATVPGDVTVSLDDVLSLDRIDATAGLSAVADQVAPADRSGLFVLVLRPVEYATRAITKYPVATKGKRSSESGDIAEAVAITLVPFAVDGLDDDPWHQRSRIASVAFMEQALRGIPSEALPLAMLRLDKGTIRWLDVYLVRRDVAAAHEAVVGLGMTPRPLREAHLLQYDQQLREIVVERRRGAGLRFAAADYFEVLPAAGRMPAAAIDPGDFTQVFFPATMTVSLTIVPTDELPMLLEESLQAAPIQVAGAPEDLDFTAIQVLIPATRQTLRALRPRSVARVGVSPTVPSLRRPLDILNHLTFGTPSVAAAIAPGDPIAAQWRQLLAAQGDGMLWFTRRPALALSMQVAPPADPPPVEVVG